MSNAIHLRRQIAAKCLIQEKQKKKLTMGYVQDIDQVRHVSRPQVFFSCSLVGTVCITISQLFQSETHFDWAREGGLLMSVGDRQGAIN